MRFTSTNETPQVIQIAHLDSDPSMDPPAHLLPEKVICYDIYEDRRIVFRVWDFLVNHTISFSAKVDVNRLTRNVEGISQPFHHAEVSFWLIVGNCDEDSNHRLKWRRDINLGHPTPYYLNCRIFSITIPLIYIPRCHFAPHWIYFMEHDLPLVFWLFSAPLFRHSNVHRVPNHRQTRTSMIPLYAINTSEVPHLFDDNKVNCQPYNILRGYSCRLLAYEIMWCIHHRLSLPTSSRTAAPQPSCCYPLPGIPLFHMPSIQ